MGELLGRSAANAQRYLEPETVCLFPRDVQEDSPLYCLPQEVKEIIMDYLDGLSLVRLSCTCALFFNLINEKAAWERCLLFECDEFYHLIDLGLNFGVPLWKISPPRSRQMQRYLRTLGYPWKQMFYSTQMWKKFAGVKTWSFEIFHTSNVTGDEITAFNIAGQDIIFGTLKGGLGLWNPDKYRTSLTSILHAPGEVDQILVQLTHDLHYRIITHYIDTSLIIYDMRGYAISKGTYKRRNLRKICGNAENLIEWDPETGSNACVVVKGNRIETCSGYKDGHLPGGPFVAADFSQQLFISRKQGPLLVEYDPLAPNNSLQSGKFLLGNEHNLCISRAYIWPERISFSISAGGVLIVSVGCECKLIRWPPMFKCVSAFLFAHVLMIGTNIGQILFYPFDDPLDLLGIDPQDYHQAIDTGTCEPVIYVGVRVQNKIHHFPDVIAATKSKMFCFRANGLL